MSTKTATATFIKQRNGAGEGRVYRVDPPMATGWDGEGPLTEHVWVSASVTYSGPETYIFACDANGKLTDWCELEGSFRGGLDHVQALRNAGYTVQS